ncbi:MAG TPA: tetratricopeptide repeat protein [Chroococcales cyanobacterium]
MYKLNERRALLTLGLMTFLAASPQLLVSQAASQTPEAPTGQVMTPPATPPTHEELGDTLSVHRRYQAAIEEYSKAPMSAAVWNKMGIAYQMMFNSKDATRCYRESLKLDSRNPQVLNNLATVYDSLKDYHNAEKTYRKALKIEPNSPLILKNLGTNLLAQHKYSRGWEEYQKAMALDPQIFQDKSSPQVQNPSTVAERGAMNYYMAAGCARMGQVDCTLQYLRMALNEGFTSPKKVASDMAFANLRDNPDFKEMLAAQENTKPAQAR